MRLARAYDERREQRLFLRLAHRGPKYWICKRAPWRVGEALECLGGNGYVEESGMPRLFRESPLNSIWEGSGNVNALDVLRAIAKSRSRSTRSAAEVDRAAGADPRLDGVRDSRPSSPTSNDRVRARRLVERMALVLQGSLLVRHSPRAVADAFCASRLGGDHGRSYGTLPPGVDVASIVERHRPIAFA